MTDFLLELLSEEIPARMQDKARDDLARLFTAELAKAGLAATHIETFATPRRLALIAKGLPLETAAVSEEIKGPKVGAPPQALEGFLRKTGLSADQLVERDGVYFAMIEKTGRKTADVLADAIPAIIRAFPWPKSMRWGAASHSTESLRWVRPLQGIIALLGDDVVDCAIDGIVSGRTTAGHRFHSTGPVTIANATSYAADLRAAHVILDQDERRAMIRTGAETAATDAGLLLVPDEGLVVENAGLTEWPVPMLGRFDPAFLDVPEEVIQLTARVNQKYFVCHDAAGKLANAFVCTANIVATDGGAAIIAGNEKVLAARLSDAKFFYEQDLKTRLEDHAAKLDKIVFHEKLGSVADKVERVAKLARWLVETGVIKSSPLVGEGGEHSETGEGGASQSPNSRNPSPSAAGAAPPSPARGEGYDVAALANQAERAARLCKADLVTGMVGEFPELQGIMGGYYARAQGEDDAVADAIRDHYKPVGQGDDVPTAPVTVAVSLADKLDTISAFFGRGMPPTGSSDPFALRRAALGVLRLVSQNGLRLNLIVAYAKIAGWLTYSLVLREQQTFVKNEAQVLERVSGESSQLKDAAQQDRLRSRPEVVSIGAGFNEAVSAFVQFLADRLKVQQKEAGVRHDLIDAVFALGGEDDLVRLLARVHALQAFITTDAGANLLAGYKRAANILKQAGAGDDNDPRHAELVSASMDSSWSLKQVQGDERFGGADSALFEAIDTAEPQAAAAIAAEQFEEAMAALASLRGPIDAFFDGVMVNDPDADVRAFRLGLLTRFRNAVHQVADFSKIEG